MKQYGKMHFWGEMFEDVIDLRIYIGRFMKFISLATASITIVYSLAWLIFNVLHIVADDRATMEVKVSVYALLAFFNAVFILVLLYMMRNK
jgi:hypothetical protein